MYFDLEETTSEILASNYEATGWLAVATEVLESERGFPVRLRQCCSHIVSQRAALTIACPLAQDSALLAGAFLQDDVCSNREIVTVGQLADEGIGREQCIFHERSRATELFYRDTGCERASTETGDYIVPNKYRPRCLVLVSEADSAEQMLEDMLLQARADRQSTVQPELRYDYCRRTRLRGRGGALTISLLLQSQTGGLTDQDSSCRWWMRRRRSRPRRSSSLYSNTLAGVSVAVVDAELQQLQDKETALQSELAALQAELDALRAQAAVVCVPSETNTCGRSATQAPNPWIAADGTHCVGFETLEVYPGAFCARWGDPVSCSVQPAP